MLYPVTYIPAVWLRFPSVPVVVGFIDNILVYPFASISFTPVTVFPFESTIVTGNM